MNNPCGYIWRRLAYSGRKDLVKKWALVTHIPVDEIEDRGYTAIEDEHEKNILEVRSP